MDKHITRAQKIMERINELAAISEDPNAVTRRFGTPAFLQGSSLVRQWMEQAGLETYIDNIGNVRGKLKSANPDAKTFVIASHIDTVKNAGKFDGPLGVLMGIDLIAELIASQKEIPFNIELIAFSDEEGVRFHTTFLGSKVVTGAFDKTLLRAKDEDGISLQTAIETMGGNIEALAADVIPKEDWLGYFEIHIEQGPVLYEKEIPIAIVTAIAGQKRVQVRFSGMAGHAGTVPMHMRQDALCAAAEFVLAVEKFGLGHKDNIVATVGKLDILNAASNVIPGDVTCSLDLRSHDESILASAHGVVRELCEVICNKRNILLNWNLVQETLPVTCDASMQNLLEAAVVELGYETVKLVSGAGHDAVPISEVSPVAMLFVRCYRGISHNPLENVELGDLAAAIEVADGFLEKMMLGNSQLV